MVKSPDTYTSQSTARISEMSVVGSPTASRMMARVNTPPAGIPAAPTLEAVAVTLANRKEKVKIANVKSRRASGLLVLSVKAPVCHF